MSPVVLILGAGPRVGAAVASKFASQGYKVAVTSRKGLNGKDANGQLSLQADFSKPETIAPVFAKVQAEYGSAPNVVIYNAAALTPPSDPNSVFSISSASVAGDLTVNTVSAYVAAQEALKGWATLPQGAKNSFIYTGNILSVKVLPIPMFFTLGMGKSASSFFIGAADQLYSATGHRFFYAEERSPDGNIKGKDLDGDAHAEFFLQLASHEGNIPWHASFVKGAGYTKF